MWNLPRLGIEPVSPALAGGFLPTVLPGASPTWNLAWLLWPLLTLGSSACQNSCCPPAKITWNRWDGMGLVIASVSKAPPILVAPAVTSCESHPMDKVLARVSKLCCDLRQLHNPGTFWITGNDGLLEANWMFWPQGVSLIAELPHSQSSPAVSSACTKVLYFTDRSLTPFMVNIPKRWDSESLFLL